jgi:hypothetical protein
VWYGWKLNNRPKLRGLLNRPQRERLSWFKLGILMIRKIKPTIAIGAEVGLIFAEIEFIKCACIFFAPDLNGYEILITSRSPASVCLSLGSFIRQFLLRFHARATVDQEEFSGLCSIYFLGGASGARLCGIDAIRDTVKVRQRSLRKPFAAKF